MIPPKSGATRPIGAGWKELYTHLQSEAEQQEVIAQRLTQKSELLVTGRVDALAELDRALVAETRKARNLAAQRQALLERMGCADMPLSGLIARLDGEAARELSTMRDRLRLAARNVENLNRDSRDLLVLSLNWVQETISIIAHAVAPEGAGYTAQGGLPVANASSAPAHSTLSRSV